MPFSNSPACLHTIHIDTKTAGSYRTTMPRSGNERKKIMRHIRLLLASWQCNGALERRKRRLANYKYSASFHLRLADAERPGTARLVHTWLPGGGCKGGVADENPPVTSTRCVSHLYWGRGNREQESVMFAGVRGLEGNVASVPSDIRLLTCCIVERCP